MTTKYDIGDHVYFQYKGKFCKATVKGIEITNGKIVRYSIHEISCWFEEVMVHKNLEDLAAHAVKTMVDFTIT